MHRRVIYVVYTVQSRMDLENAESDAKVFFRILAEIVDQLSAFAGELIEIRCRLVDVIEERFVRNQLAERTFSRLCIGKDRVDLGRGRVETSKRILGVIIQLLVLKKFSERSAACRQIARDHFKIVRDTVYLSRRRTEIDYGRPRFIVESIVRDKLTR